MLYPPYSILRTISNRVIVVQLRKLPLQWDSRGEQLYLVAVAEPTVTEVGMAMAAGLNLPVAFSCIKIAVILESRLESGVDHTIIIEIFKIRVNGPEKQMVFGRSQHHHGLFGYGDNVRWYRDDRFRYLDICVHRRCRQIHAAEHDGQQQTRLDVV